ncbi:MAG: response regulator transcription factor [Spirochaetales bacterium]|nr:response regulator transcription factor [Spirochaetales bacterium]
MSIGKKYTVVIVDDHPIVRQGFEQLLEQEPDLVVIGGAEDAVGALELIAKKVPDIALVDLSLKNSSGLELIKDLIVLYPDIKILVISLHDEEVYAERTIRAGARGFIMKAEATENVVGAVKRVLKGEIYLSEEMKSQMLERLVAGKKKSSTSIIDDLSDREIQVFELMGEGMKNQAIAAKLHISIKTVETYKSHLKSKLNLKDSAELMQRAVEWNLKNNYLNEKSRN